MVNMMSDYKTNTLVLYIVVSLNAMPSSVSNILMLKITLITGYISEANLILMSDSLDIFILYMMFEIFYSTRMWFKCSPVPVEPPWYIKQK